MDEILLTEAAEEEGFDVTDQMEITKYLKLRVSRKVLRLELGSILFRFRSWSTRRTIYGTDAMPRQWRTAK
jgi:hypothetical protein